MRLAFLPMAGSQTHDRREFSSSGRRYTCRQQILRRERTSSRFWFLMIIRKAFVWCLAPLLPSSITRDDYARGHGSLSFCRSQSFAYWLQSCGHSFELPWANGNPSRSVATREIDFGAQSQGGLALARTGFLLLTRKRQ